MNQLQFEKMMKMIQSDVDADVAMGIRSLQGLLEAGGVTLSQAMLYAIDHISEVKNISVSQNAAAPKVVRAAVQASGMPQCNVPKPGCLEVIDAGKTEGEIVALQGAAVQAVEDIALHLKDVLAAAVMNKSRFKLKLKDIKNDNGEIIETHLQAEYDREGMMPILVWKNVKGEVASLATVLRKVVKVAVPDLVA